MDEIPTPELLDAARRGDRNALEALLLRHQEQIYRFGLRMCRDQEDARDVLQETLFAMAKGVSSFRGASSLSTWLFSIARSFCIKKRRRDRPEPPSSESLPDEAGEVESISDSSRSPHEIVAARQLEKALEVAIARLDGKYREVLLLRDIEGLSTGEVAEVLELTQAAVKSRLHRARVSVRDVLSPLFETSTISSADKNELLPFPSEGKLHAGPKVRTAIEDACPDVLEILAEHLEGEITAEKCAEMERHMKECELCQAQCDSLRRTLALCRSASSETVVPERVQKAVRASLRELLSGVESESFASRAE